MPAYPVVTDPARPRWHFGPPAQWMNDPNGTLWHDGWYHAFYQHNPGADAWGDLHWGHARSRDLVQWEHLPLALFPRHAHGELHCYSGCAARDAGGTPRILYTSVPPGSERAATQVLASPADAGLLAWTQDVAAPVLDLATQEGPRFDRDWRDPYVFHAEGRTFLVLGATVGDEAAVALYENPEGDLRTWRYRGLLHRGPRSATPFCECPNFFPLDGKWVLLVSPCREVEWHVGTFDAATGAFRAERHGRVDASDHYYATQTIVDPAGRTILLGWARKFPEGRGWNGCLAAPRRAWLDAAGHFCTEPVTELAALRTSVVRLGEQQLGAQPLQFDLPGDASHEAELTFTRAAAATVRVEFAGTVVTVGPEGVRFEAGQPVPLAAGAPVRLRWMLDRSLVEGFVNGRASWTRVVPFPPPGFARVSAVGGSATLLAAQLHALRAAPPTFLPAP